MKSPLQIIVFVSVFIVFSCSTKVEKPQDVGRLVFNMLKNIKDKESYMSKFISLEKMRVYLNDDEMNGVDEKGKNHLTNLDKSVIEAKKLKKYNYLIEKGKEININWEKIEFNDFAYRLTDWDGIKGCKGVLSFKTDSTIYKIIKIEALRFRGEYHLLTIKGGLDKIY